MIATWAASSVVYHEHNKTSRTNYTFNTVILFVLFVIRNLKSEQAQHGGTVYVFGGKDAVAALLIK